MSPRSSHRFFTALASLFLVSMGTACVQPEASPQRPDDADRRTGSSAVAASPSGPSTRPGLRQPPADPTPAVDALLGAYETQGDEATWKRLGEGAKPRLIEVLTSTDEMSLRRARAAEALGFLAGPEEVSLLASFAADTSNPATARGGALTGLGRALGPRAVGAVSPYLNDADPLIRKRAARVLAELDTPESREALRERLPTVTGAEREEIERLLVD